MRSTISRRLLSAAAIAVPLLTAVPAYAWTLQNIEQMMENPLGIRLMMHSRSFARRPKSLSIPGLPPTLLRTGNAPAFILRSSVMSRPSRRTIRASVGRRSRSSSSARFSRSSIRSASASSVSGALDPETDTSLRGRFALLGTTSPILGSVEAFNNAEPLAVTSITVTLDSAVTSVDHILIYDDNARLLGSARLDPAVSGGRTYTLNLKTRDLVIPQRENYSFYVRAVLKSRTTGGTSAELLVVDSIAVAGNGFWSNRSYNQSLTDDFNTHQIARSVITSVANAGAASEPLLSGSDREVGKFRFAGIRGDGSADLRLTELTFTVSHTGNVSLSNAEIVADGSSDRSSCTISSSTITCPLASSFGSLSSGPRTLTLFADVSVPSSASRASLQISLNEPGTPTSAGAIQWTDGSNTFEWVGLEAPVVRGTYYSY